jgi:hypothetical protein
MIISQHLISEAEIIGIGPLMTERKDDPLYPTIRHYFMLYCKQQSIRIESDLVLTGDFAEQKQKERNKKYLNDFMLEYHKVRDEIKLLITK